MRGPVSLGTVVGAYRVVSLLAEGAMGTVYVAEGPNGEHVALKILLAPLAEDTRFRERFLRETGLAARLHHPRIVSTIASGEHDGILWLAMELVDGVDLRTLLKREGALEPRRAIGLLSQVAEALDVAHAAGLVHRDVKPGNILVRGEDAYLCDFGLARHVSSVSSLTSERGFVGTIDYVAPEQIQGGTLDRRADVYALGCVLFECLGGARPYEADSDLTTLFAHLNEPPPRISDLNPALPAALDDVIARALAKAPDDRCATCGELIAAATAALEGRTVATGRRRRGLLVAAAGLVAALYSNRLASARQPLRASIEQPAGFDLAPVLGGAPALSPDGIQLAFVASPKGKNQAVGPDFGGTLLVRNLSTGATTPLAGTEGGSFPFWSPEGKYLAFFAQGKLKKIEVGGGPVQVLCDAPEGRGGSWSPQGTIIFAPRIAGPLLAVSDGGGTPTLLPAARKEAVDFTNRNPTFLPDGKHYLFIARGGNESLGSVYAGSLDGGEPRLILSNASNVAYSDGHLFFVKEGTLTAQPFNGPSLRLEGKPISIAANVDYYNPRDLGYFSVSRNVLVYRAAAIENRDLAWLDSAGKELEHWGEPATYSGGKFSPTSQLAILLRDNDNGRGNSLWLADIQRKTVNRLTGDAELVQTGIAAPDGNSVFIATTSGYVSTLVRRWLTASGREEKLLDEPRSFFEVTSVSRDGRYVFFSQQDPKTSFDIYYMDLLGDRKVTPLLNSPYAEQEARLSPNGKWLAYTSSETGKTELYVTPFPGTGSKWQVSNGGVVARGENFIMDWSADGKNLRYQQADKLYNVEVRENGDKLEFSAPKEMLTLTGDPVVLAILPDGKRILAARRVGDQSPSPLEVILNWQQVVR